MVVIPVSYTHLDVYKRQVYMDRLSLKASLLFLKLWKNSSLYELHGYLEKMETILSKPC